MTGIEGGPLVDTVWLGNHLHDPDLVVLDGSYHLVTEKRDARAEYLKTHIPGARFFDIDAVSDLGSPLPHMLPPAAEFAAHVGAMGIGDASRVVVYDSVGMYSAPRVWWTFRAMGLEAVAVLDGGLPKWESEGRPVESGAPAPPRRAAFTPRPVPALVRGRDDVLAIVRKGGATVVDARAAGRFAGAAPEPRAGLRSGHIPGSVNIPFPTLLNKDGTYKTDGQLRAIFQAVGLDGRTPVVTSCGSGVTASVVSLAFALAGYGDAAVYDGSWSEWGADPALPIETGPVMR